jgi:hypothetical protein
MTALEYSYFPRFLPEAPFVIAGGKNARFPPDVNGLFNYF